MALTREDYIAQSVDTYFRGLLKARGYTDDVVTILPSFPHEGIDESPLKKTHIAFGFNFDDGGKEAEMGSNLKRKIHTIEFFIFGQTPNWGKNVANAVKFTLERDGIIPLLDIADPARPRIDSLVVISVPAAHVPVNNPQPWQENCWTVQLRLEDTYQPSEAVT